MILANSAPTLRRFLLQNLNRGLAGEAAMTVPTEDFWLRQAALVYVIALYGDLTAENVAPTLGTQNQAVDFILADPELRRAVGDWARRGDVLEAHVAPPRRPPQDALYRRVRGFIEQQLKPGRVVRGEPPR